MNKLNLKQLKTVARDWNTISAELRIKLSIKKQALINQIKKYHTFEQTNQDYIFKNKEYKGVKKGLKINVFNKKSKTHSKRLKEIATKATGARGPGVEATTIGRLREEPATEIEYWRGIRGPGVDFAKLSEVPIYRYTVKQFKQILKKYGKNLYTHIFRQAGYKLRNAGFISDNVYFKNFNEEIKRKELTKHLLRAGNNKKKASIILDSFFKDVRFESRNSEKEKRRNTYQIILKGMRDIVR